MRVAHVNFSPGGGVDKKISHLSALADASDLPLDFYLMNRGGDRDSGRLQWRRRRRVMARGTLLRYLHANLIRYREIRQILKTHDIVILRFPKVPFNNILVLSLLGRWIITEHHTDEIGELTDTGRWRRRLLTTGVSLVSRIILARVAGVIAVTDEIRRVELKKAGPRPSLTVTNGIAVDATPRTGFAPFDGKCLRMVLVASHFQPWHGVDRLIEGIRVYSGALRIELDLVGRGDDGLAETAATLSLSPHKQVRVDGYLDGSELDHMLGNANLAVASLAIHRNGMDEACTLKVREYTARGIPFIYSYYDPDVPRDAVFARHIEPSDNPVDLAGVAEFAEAVSRIPDLSAQMRRHARTKMDWAGKIRELHEFAAGLSASTEPQ